MTEDILQKDSGFADTVHGDQPSKYSPRVNILKYERDFSKQFLKKCMAIPGLGDRVHPALSRPAFRVV